MTGHQWQYPSKEQAMSVDAAAPHDSRIRHARRAFRKWRKSRPFWGGLLLILAGLEIFYSGNLNLGNIQIHLGLIGFKSYIIPLVVVLCGVLTWVTPSQRLFYGIVGNAAVVYSIVSVNLGGFLIGLLLGIFGGALSIAWVPDKSAFRPATAKAGGGDGNDGDGVDGDDGRPTEPGYDSDATTDFGAGFPGINDDPDAWKPEGEQRDPFRGPRHSADDEPEPIAPSVGVQTHAPRSRARWPLSRLRRIPDVPGAREPEQVES